MASMLAVWVDFRTCRQVDRAEDVTAALGDLGYFLRGSLTIEDRRASEAALLDEYRHALELADDERPTREDIGLRYRASVAHGLAIWLATASSDTWQRPEVSRTLAQRYATAFVDLDSAAAIDDLLHE